MKGGAQAWGRAFSSRVVVDVDSRVVGTSGADEPDKPAKEETSRTKPTDGGGTGAAAGAGAPPTFDPERLRASIDATASASVHLNLAPDGASEEHMRAVMLLQRAQGIMATQRGEEADEQLGLLLAEAAHLAPGFMPAHMYLADWLANRGGAEDDAALEQVARAKEALPSWADTLSAPGFAAQQFLAGATARLNLVEGTVLLRRGDAEEGAERLKEAARVAKSAREVVPADAEAVSAAVVGDLGSDDASASPLTGEAMAEAHRAEADRIVSQAHQRLAALAAERQDVVQEASHYQQALDAAPSDRIARAGLIFSLLQWHARMRAAEDMHGAAAVLKQALEVLQEADDEVKHAVQQSTAERAIEMDAPVAGVTVSGLLYELGVLAESVGDQTLAVERFAQAVEADPESWQAHGRLGAVLQRSGRRDDIERSITHFREVLRLQPPVHAEYGHLGIASALQALGDPECLEHFRTAVELNPSNADAWGMLGTELLRRGEEDEGAAALRRALEADPDNRVVQHNLSLYEASKVVVQRQQKEAGEAGESKDDATDGDADASAPKERTTVEKVADKMAGKSTETKTKTEVRRSAARTLLEDAQVAAASGRNDDAEAKFRDAIEAFADGEGADDRLGWAVAHSNFGVFLCRVRGDLEQAELHGRHALRIARSGLEERQRGDASLEVVKPDTLAMMLHNMSEAVTRLGKLDELERDCRDVISFLKEKKLAAQPIVHYQLGTVLLMRNTDASCEEALAQFGEALKLNSAFAPAHHNAANAYLRRHLVRRDDADMDAAEHHAREAVRHDADGLDPRVALLEVLFRRVDWRAVVAQSQTGAPPGGYNEAELAWEKEGMRLLHESLTVFPTSPALHFLMGRRLMLKARFDDAVTHLRRALEGGAVMPEVHAAMLQALALALAQCGPAHYDEALAKASEAVAVDKSGAASQFHTFLASAMQQAKAGTGPLVQPAPPQ